jgi:diguanylate cyclase (GGDEF)-like protein
MPALVALAAVALALALLEPAPYGELHIGLLAGALVACAAGGLLAALAPDGPSLQPNLVFFFAGAVLLPAWAVGALAVACFAPALATRRTSLAAALGGTAGYVLSGLAAQRVVVLAGDFGASHARTLVALVVATAVAVGIRHAIAALGAEGSRVVPLRRLLAHASEDLPRDLALGLTGACLAVLWQLAPPLCLLALGPMLLIQRALGVPLLEDQMRTDEKTGLFRFRHLRSELSGALERARRTRGDLSVVMFDVDALRAVNTEHGRLAGDEAVRAVGRVLGEVAGPRGPAARVGGQGFCLVLPDHGLALAKEVADTVRARVAALRLTAPEGGAYFGVTVSAGIAGYPEHADTGDALVHAADEGLYDAKVGGRNRVRITLPERVREALREPGVAPTRGDAATPTGAGAGAGAAAGARGSGGAGGSSGAAAADASGPEPGSAGGGLGPAAGSAPAPGPAAHGAPLGPAPDSLAPGAPVGPAPGLPTASRAAEGPAGHAPSVRRALGAHGALLCLGALAVGLASSWSPIARDPLLFLLLVAAVVLLDLVNIDLFERGNISPGAVPSLALAFAFGPLGPLTAEAVAAARRAALREPATRWSIDFGNLVLAGAAAAVAFSLVPHQHPLGVLAAATLGGVVYYAVNGGLLAAVWHIVEGAAPGVALRERFAWAWWHYVAYGALAGVFTLFEHSVGPVALGALTLPVFMLWLSQKQYLDRSRESVTELRRSYDELADANGRLKRLLGDNEELLGRMHRSYLSTITSLARTIEAKDPYTGGHTDRVAEIACLIARELSFNANELRALEVGAVIHDIGKIGIPDAILLKPGRLTDEEFAEMRRHPEISSYIVAELELPPIVKQVVRSHHERFDGGGYPDGLRGEEIPIAARILTVADTLDAMTSDRPYRAALPLAEARAELQHQAGKQFCPRVVAALERSVEAVPEYWAPLERDLASPATQAAARAS